MENILPYFLNLNWARLTFIFARGRLGKKDRLASFSLLNKLSIFNKENGANLK